MCVGVGVDVRDVGCVYVAVCTCACGRGCCSYYYSPRTASSPLPTCYIDLTGPDCRFNGFARTTTFQSQNARALVACVSQLSMLSCRTSAYRQGVSVCVYIGVAGLSTPVPALLVAVCQVMKRGACLPPCQCGADLHSLGLPSAQRLQLGGLWGNMSQSRLHQLLM